MKAEDLAASNQVVDAESDTVPVVSVEFIEKETTVYNFEVLEHHNYFVSALGLLVHNVCEGAAGAGKPVKPEAAVTGSKKHGVKWKEGPARAANTNTAQGQWAGSDLDYATQMANTLKPRESAYFNLPEGFQSIVHMPDGTTVKAARFWIRNNGTGTWHGYPMP